MTRLVLVTGGTGYLGRAVVAELLADGHRVRLLSRGTGTDEQGADVVRGDVTDPVSLRAAANGVDAVCHLAGLPRARAGRDDVRAVNAGGTLALLEALRGDAVPFVLASSAAVYGGASGTLDESAPVAPVNAYGESKALAEQHVSEAAGNGRVAGVSLRCFNVAGAVPGSSDRDPTRIVNRALAAAHGGPGLTVNGDGGTLRDYVHVRDAAAAFRLALEWAEAARLPENRCYNVGSGHGSSLLEVVAAVQAVTGRPVPVTFGPAAQEARTLVADLTRAERELVWEPVHSQLGRIVHDAHMLGS